MPWTRPQLSELRNGVAQDIASAIPGSDPLLRFANLRIMGNVQAGLAHLHYGYLDYIALQSNPFTATDEYLEAWAALKNIFREPATSASGQITFQATPNIALIPSGTPITRGDGVGCTTTADATSNSSGIVVVSATIDADPSGLTGAFGNTAVGVTMTLGISIAGVKSSGTVTTAFTGGADIELDSSLRSRMLEAYQKTPQGGAKADYEIWAREVPGVTRSWCNPLGAGSGTVVVYIMLDQAESAFNGFPQGTNGVATNEPRDTPATGDQLIVANYIYALRPATALVYIVSPVAYPVNFTISGLSAASSSTQAAISQAISGVFQLAGTPLGGTVDLDLIESAIAAIPGTSGFVITSPAGNIVTTIGQLPVLGTVTYA